MVTKREQVRLSKLQVKSGDVVVLRLPEYASQETLTEMSARLAQAFANQGLEHILVIALPIDLHIEVLSPEDMTKHGWVRDPSRPSVQMKTTRDLPC